MTQKDKKGYKLIKIRTETFALLDKEIAKIDKKYPVFKGLLSYNAIIMMLLRKKRVKLSKYKYMVLKK